MGPVWESRLHRVLQAVKRLDPTKETIRMMERLAAKAPEAYVGRDGVCPTCHDTCFVTMELPYVNKDTGETWEGHHYLGSAPCTDCKQGRVQNANLALDRAFMARDERAPKNIDEQAKPAEGESDQPCLFD